MQKVSLSKRISTKIIVATVLVAVLCCSAVTTSWAMREYAEGSEQTTALEVLTQQSELVFSHEDAFYTATVSLEISTAKPSMAIYYTTDGTPPQSSETRLTYTEPIKLKGSGIDVNSYTIKACAQYEDGSFSKTKTQSYFIGKEVDERFDAIVFSISTDPYNLYDYEYGIFVEGKIRDDYIATKPSKVIEAPDPANFNMRGIEWERPIYLEVFESDGSKVISQDCGVRVQGGWSRAGERKSMKLFARSEYDALLNDFDYEFFPNALDSDGARINDYKRLVLRNNANDESGSFLREEVITALAEDASILDTQQARPASVYLNGEYYGFFWLHEVYDGHYFDENYGTDDGDWRVLEGGDLYKNVDEEDEASVEAKNDYDEMYSKYSTCDLTDDTLFEELCNEIDLDNFLMYYCIETYIANDDWPHNNYRCYKYYGEPQEGIADGRWRWLLFDTEWGMGLYEWPPEEDSIGLILGKGDYNRRSDLLINLLKREDVKEKYVTIMCDLANGAFSPSATYQKVKALSELRSNELYYAVEHRRVPSWQNRGNIVNNENTIVWFASERPAEIRKRLKMYFGVTDTYQVTVTSNPNADIKINTYTLEASASEFQGEYFVEYSTRLEPTIAEGYEFSHWLVNGGAVYDEVFEAGVPYGTDLKIELVLKESVGARLVISEVGYEGGGDYIVLYNPYSENVSTMGLYLSDDPTRLTKSHVATMIVKAGESVKIYCDNYLKVDAIGGLSCAFNLKDGETLYLSHGEELLESVYLPKMQNSSCYRRDRITGEFREEDIE